MSPAGWTVKLISHRFAQFFRFDPPNRFHAPLVFPGGQQMLIAAAWLCYFPDLARRNRL
jgi:hypothetical protein